MTFTGTTGTVKLDDSLAFTGRVSGLTAADALDLSDVSYGVNTRSSFSGTTKGGTLTVTDGSHTAKIALLGNYLSSGWTLSGDGNGGTVVVDPPLSPSFSGAGTGGSVGGAGDTSHCAWHCWSITWHPPSQLRAWAKAACRWQVTLTAPVIRIRFLQNPSHNTHILHDEGSVHRDLRPTGDPRFIALLGARKGY